MVETMKKPDPAVCMKCPNYYLDISGLSYCKHPAFPLEREWRTIENCPIEPEAVIHHEVILQPGADRDHYIMYVGDQVIRTVTSGELVKIKAYIESDPRKKAVPKLITLMLSIAGVTLGSVDAEKFFENFIHAFLHALDDAQDKHEDQVQSITPIHGITIEQLLDELPKAQADALEFYLTIIISPPKVRNPLWAYCIGPPSIGKSFLLEFLDTSPQVFILDDMTENCLSPGKPNVESGDVHALFNDAQGKCLVFPDMSAQLMQRADRVIKLLGQFTNAYGGRYRQFSPGTGKQQLHPEFSMICSMTYECFKTHWKSLSKLGQRFLVYHFNRSLTFYAIDEEQFQRKMLGFVADTIQLAMPIIPTDIEEDNKSFCELTVWMRSFQYVNNPNEIEGAFRLQQTTCLAMQCHARLFHRDQVNREDFAFVKELAYNTIPNMEFLSKIYWTDVSIGSDHSTFRDAVLDRGARFGIFEKHDVESIGVNKHKYVRVCYRFKSPYQEYMMYFNSAPPDNIPVVVPIDDTISLTQATLDTSIPKTADKSDLEVAFDPPAGFEEADLDVDEELKKFEQK
jgi:hypothetical protein